VRELPQINQDLLRRITQGLVAEIVKPENMEKNRMTVRNLAIVFAPGFLKNTSDDPMEMLNSQRFENCFVTRLFDCLLKELRWRSHIIIVLDYFFLTFSAYLVFVCLFVLFVSLPFFIWDFFGGFSYRVQPILGDIKTVLQSILIRGHVKGEKKNR